MGAWCNSTVLLSVPQYAYGITSRSGRTGTNRDRQIADRVTSRRAVTLPGCGGRRRWNSRPCGRAENGSSESSMPSVRFVGSKTRRRSSSAAGWGNAADFQPAQFNRGAVRRPESGRVVRRVAGGGQLQNQPKVHRTFAPGGRPALRAGNGSRACPPHRASSTPPRPRAHMVAAEAAAAIGGDEPEGILGMVAGLGVTGRDGLIH